MLTPEFPKPIVNAPSLESLILIEDTQLRTAVVEEFFYKRCPNDNFAYGGATQMEYPVQAEAYALLVMSDHLEEVEDPIGVVRSFLPAAANDIDLQLIMTSIISTRLHQVVGPEATLEAFADLDRTQYWGVHHAIPTMMFRMNNEWVQESQDAQQYLNELLRGDYPLELRRAAFDGIARLFPYQSNILINAIKDMLEDDHEYMRGLAKFYLELWELKHAVVMNASAE